MVFMTLHPFIICFYVHIFLSYDFNFYLNFMLLVFMRISRCRVESSLSVQLSTSLSTLFLWSNTSLENLTKVSDVFFYLVLSSSLLLLYYYSCLFFLYFYVLFIFSRVFVLFYFVGLWHCLTLYFLSDFVTFSEHFPWFFFSSNSVNVSFVLSKSVHGIFSIMH